MTAWDVVQAVRGVHVIRGVTPSHGHTLLMLATHCDKNHRAWPSQALLAQETGYTRETINRHLRFWRQMGFIHKVGTRGNDVVEFYIDVRAIRQRVSPRPACDASVTGDLPQNHTSETSQDHSDVTLEADPCDATVTGPCDATVTRNLHGNLQGNLQEPPDELALVALDDVADPDADFEAFWSQYPRRVSKAKARQSFKAALKAGATPAFLIEQAQRLAARHARLRTEPQFIPHAATWLNQRRWEDPDEAMPLSTEDRRRSQHQRETDHLFETWIKQAWGPADMTLIPEMKEIER